MMLQFRKVGPHDHVSEIHVTQLSILWMVIYGWLHFTPVVQEYHLAINMPSKTDPIVTRKLRLVKDMKQRPRCRSHPFLVMAITLGIFHPGTIAWLTLLPVCGYYIELIVVIGWTWHIPKW